MACILATDFDFIAYMSKMAFFFVKLFFTPMALLEYDTVCRQLGRQATKETTHVSLSRDSNHNPFTSEQDIICFSLRGRELCSSDF